MKYLETQNAFRLRTKIIKYNFYRRVSDQVSVMDYKHNYDAEADSDE